MSFWKALINIPSLHNESFCRVCSVSLSGGVYVNLIITNDNTSAAKSVYPKWVIASIQSQHFDQQGTHIKDETMRDIKKIG